MYKIILTKNNESQDITNLVSDLSWSENIDTIGATLSFSVPDKEERYIPRLLIMAGDIVQLFGDSGELIRAIVVNVSRT